MEYDIIIIGAGPAGITAGIYALRSGLKVCIISKFIGGAANRIEKIDNWPGFSGTGRELMKKFYDSLKKFNPDFVPEDAVSAEKNGKGFIVKTKEKSIEGRALIIATGKERKKLGVPGEEELAGRGVSYCTTCDAFFFKDKVVAFACYEKNTEDEKTLLKIAKKVYLVNPSEITEIRGKEKVESIITEEKGKRKEIPVDAVFIEIGSVSARDFLKNLKAKIDKDGFVVVDSEMKTSIQGVFAAGDITNSKLKQVLTASSQGATAAKSAGSFLKA